MYNDFDRRCTVYFLNPYMWRYIFDYLDTFKNTPLALEIDLDSFQGIDLYREQVLVVTLTDGIQNRDLNLHMVALHCAGGGNRPLRFEQK